MKLNAKIVIFLTLTLCFLLPEFSEIFETGKKQQVRSEITAFEIEMLAESEDFVCIQDTLYQNLEHLVSEGILMAYGLELVKWENPHQHVFLRGWIKSSALDLYVYDNCFDRGVRLMSIGCCVNLIPSGKGLQSDATV